jgi:hypothetical protein
MHAVAMMTRATRPLSEAPRWHPTPSLVLNNRVGRAS